MTERIAIALSGGVDSSVAAARLVAGGAEIFGIMLRLWSGGPGGANRCCSPADLGRARGLAADLGIPFYAVDVQDRFKTEVVDFFVDGYTQGITPNPCMECNRSVRWTFMLNHALQLGASRLATGHYARVRRGGAGYELLRARDQHKDQSYVLSVLGQQQLARAVFPLGELTKEQVRTQASRLGLAAADRSDSQDLCFLGGSDYRSFLEFQGVPQSASGDIVDVQGNVIGQHQGLAHYTIGQRKGIGIFGPTPLYVLQKDPAHNQLTVGSRLELSRPSFEIHRVNWIAGTPPQAVEANVQVRYRGQETPATIEPRPGKRAVVTGHQPFPSVTPGQAAVFYDEDVCLGSGIIDR